MEGGSSSGSGGSNSDLVKRFKPKRNRFLVLSPSIRLGRGRGKGKSKRLDKELVETYTLRERINEEEVREGMSKELDEKQMLHKKEWSRIECACTAILFYNKVHGVRFEVVEVFYNHSTTVLCAPTTGRPTVWHHINFLAKPRSGDDSTQKLFFAELYQRKAQFSGGYRAVSCSMIDPFDFFSCSCMHKDKGEDKSKRLNTTGKIKRKGLCKELSWEQILHEKEWSDIECSRIAIAFYNDQVQQNSTHFEVFKIVSRCSIFLCAPTNDGTSKPTIWHHLTFLAKPLFGDDSSAKLFFAELYERNMGFGGGYCVVSCSDMDPNNNENRLGCGFCAPTSKMLHPAEGLRVGNWPFTRGSMKDVVHLALSKVK